MAYFFYVFKDISHSNNKKGSFFPISVTVVQTGQAAASTQVADKPSMHVWNKLTISCKHGKEGLNIWVRMIKRIWKGQQKQET